MRAKAAFATEFLLRELLLALGVDTAAGGTSDSLSESWSMSEDSASQSIATGAGGAQPRVMLVRRTSHAQQSMTLVDRQFDVEAFVPSSVLATLEQTHGYKTLGRLKGSVVRVDKYHFATYARCMASDSHATSKEKSSIFVPTVNGGAKARVYLYVGALSVVDDNELAVNSLPDVYSHPAVAARLQTLSDAELEKQLMVQQGLPSLPASASPSAPEHFGDERPLLDADCVIPDDQEKALDAQDGWGMQDFATQQPTDSELIEENGLVPMPESQSQRVVESEVPSRAQLDGSTQSQESVQSNCAKQSKQASIQDHAVDVDASPASDSQRYPFQQEDIQETFVVFSDTDSDDDGEEELPAGQQVVGTASPPTKSSHRRAFANGSGSPAAPTPSSQRSNPQMPDERADETNQDVHVDSVAVAGSTFEASEEGGKNLNMTGEEEVGPMSQALSPSLVETQSQSESVVLSGSETQLPVGGGWRGPTRLMGGILRILGIMDNSSEEQEQEEPVSELSERDNDKDAQGTDFPSQATVTFEELEDRDEESITQTLSPTPESQRPLAQALSPLQMSDRSPGAQNPSSVPLHLHTPQSDRYDGGLHEDMWVDDTHSFEYEGMSNSEDGMDEDEADCQNAPSKQASPHSKNPPPSNHGSPEKENFPEMECLPEEESPSSDADEPEFAPTPDKSSTVFKRGRNGSGSAATGFQTPSPSALSIVTTTPGTEKKTHTLPQAPTPAHVIAANGHASDTEVGNQQHDQRTAQESSVSQLRAPKRSRRMISRESASPPEVTSQPRIEAPGVDPQQSVQASSSGHQRFSKKQRRESSPKTAPRLGSQPLVDVQLRLGVHHSRESGRIPSPYSLQAICQSLGPQTSEQAPVERRSRSSRRPRRAWKKYEHLFPPLDLERLKWTITEKK